MTLSIRSSLARAAGAKMVTLPIAAGLGILTSQAIVTLYGPNALGLFGLLASVVAMLSFTDLGMGAALNNEIAADSRADDDERVHRTLLTVLRALILSGTVCFIVGALVTILALWDDLLGSAASNSSINTGAAACLALFSVTIPFGLGQRLLVGLGKTHIQVLIQVLQPVLLFSLVWFGGKTGFGQLWPAIAFYISMLTTAVASTVVAYFRMPASFAFALRRVHQLRATRGLPVAKTVRPMLIIMVAIPLATQSDRLVLSHFATAVDLNAFALASQLFGPVLSIVSIASTPLWPLFAHRRRAMGVHASVDWRPILAIAGMTGLTVVAVSLAARSVASWISHGQIVLEPALLIAFSAMVLVQAIQSPLGNMLTHQRALEVQAMLILVSLPVNVGLSIWLTTRVGASGPLVGTAVTVLVLQTIPLTWLAFRLRGGRPEVSAQPNARSAPL